MPIVTLLDRYYYAQFCRCINWELERLANLSKVTQLINVQIKIIKTLVYEVVFLANSNFSLFLS